jgi:adenylosuccinate synthase
MQKKNLFKRGKMKVDVVLGLQYGDEGKGKVCHSLLRNGEYSHVIRFNGGGNAGHTIYHNGKKMATHLIPSGVFYGVKSIIGPGCVVDTHKFFKELEYLEENGINTKGLVFIAKNTHLVQEIHIDEDSQDTSIGTTKTGNGPAYRAKYAREGIRAEDYNVLEPYLIDMYEEFYGQDNSNFAILAEGAQAFGLDIDWGDYPYVTSSHCSVASVLLNGFTHKHVENVYGVIKAYDTYDGAKDFQPKEEIFEKIQEVGQEYGVTFYRKRKCNWLDWDLVLKSARMNGVDTIIMNKVDILTKLGVWKIKTSQALLSFDTELQFTKWVKSELNKENIKVIFTYNPYDFDME